MVQYVLTPWRDRRELLKVRQQLYPAASPSATATTTTLSAAAPPPPPEPRPSASNQIAATASNNISSDGVGAPTATPAPAAAGHSSAAAAAAALANQHQAVARVSMWMQRGNCPHMVESTALLTAAILSDGESSGSVGTYAVRAAYAAAFSRFVTGLLDGHQDKSRKLSMYAVAKTIGLPATFVELRHQATHEQLPSLAKLRSAARKALAWIWDYYWRHLGAYEDDEVVIVGEAAAPGYREIVMAYLNEAEGSRKAERRKLLTRLDESQVLLTLSLIMEAPSRTEVLSGALKLSREILYKGEGGGTQDLDLEKDIEQIRMEISRSRHALMLDANAAEKPSGDTGSEESNEGDGHGWAKYQGAWRPRPIGVA